MQGRERADRQLLDAAALVGHLVPADSVFGFLARHRREVFPPELFADLFPAGTGRPGLPGEVAASVLVLQALQPVAAGADGRPQPPPDDQPGPAACRRRQLDATPRHTSGPCGGRACRS